MTKPGMRFAWGDIPPPARLLGFADDPFGRHRHHDLVACVPVGFLLLLPIRMRWLNTGRDVLGIVPLNPMELRDGIDPGERRDCAFESANRR